MSVGLIFTVLLVLFFFATTFSWFLLFDSYMKGKYDIDEATPYKKQERLHVDPKECELLEKIVIPNEIREAQKAMEMLFKLRKIYRDGWEPDWDDDNPKYSIDYLGNKLILMNNYGSCRFLSFQSKEIREKFLENFSDLIKRAKPLMS